ncbi:MAG TPA: SCO family protein [Candidatus Acidoferrum sp.]|nr:SCO family protein [Candidatus Acidoferrum sp.]
MIRRGWLLLLLLLLLVAPRLFAETYPASAVVIRVDVAHRAVQLSCQAILGYMDAMVMTLPVHNTNELKGLQPGMIVDFTLDVQTDAAYAEQIHVRPFENSSQEPMAARQLEILEAATAHARSRVAPILREGEAVPSFTLIDQNRQQVRSADLRGKVIAMTFIYTRCPLPNFCFRMSNNFGALGRRFAGEMGKNLVLLSVTFDPEHDQPEVLADYAKTWTKDTTGWHFLTGNPADVRKICAEFGVSAWQDEGLLTHSLHTIVIDRDGRLAANLEGNEYSAQQLGDLVQAVMKQPH